MGVPRVCELGPEPQGTPKTTFLAPIGSPYGRCLHFRHHIAQNFGADLARGVPPPQSRRFFSTILDVLFWEMPKICEKTLEYCLVTANFRPAGRPAGALGPYGAPWGPWGRYRALWGPMGAHRAPWGIRGVQPPPPLPP